MIMHTVPVGYVAMSSRKVARKLSMARNAERADKLARLALADSMDSESAMLEFECALEAWIARGHGPDADESE